MLQQMFDVTATRCPYSNADVAPWTPPEFFYRTMHYSAKPYMGWEMVPFETALLSSYRRSIVHSNVSFIFTRFWDIAFGLRRAKVLGYNCPCN